MQRLAVISLLLSACVGSITGGDTDPQPSPSPSDPPPDLREAKVVVRDGTRPQPGVHVLFQNADDTLIADVTTNAEGIATTKLPNGGNVTVVREFPAGTNGEPAAAPQLYTYLGVKNDDVLEVVLPLSDNTPYVTKVTVALDPGTPFGVMTPCGSAQGIAPTVEVTLYGCVGSTDFYVYELDGETAAFLKHATLAPDLDFSTEVFRGTLAVEISASNMTMPAVYLQRRLVTDHFTAYDSGILPTTATIDIPELPTADQITSAYVYDGQNTYVTARREAFSAAPSTIDIGAAMIPTPSTPALANNTLTWTETGTGTADLAIARVVVQTQDRTFVRAIAGADTMSMHVPMLPAPWTKYNVDAATDQPRIAHNLVRVTGGWDVGRARVFSFFDGADIAPMGGTATVSGFAYNEPTQK